MLTQFNQARQDNNKNVNYDSHESIDAHGKLVNLLRSCTRKDLPNTVNYASDNGLYALDLSQANLNKAPKLVSFLKRAKIHSLHIDETTFSSPEHLISFMILATHVKSLKQVTLPDVEALKDLTEGQREGYRSLQGKFEEVLEANRATSPKQVKRAFA